LIGISRGTPLEAINDKLEALKKRKLSLAVAAKAALEIFGSLKSRND